MCCQPVYVYSPALGLSVELRIPTSQSGLPLWHTPSLYDIGDRLAKAHGLHLAHGPILDKKALLRALDLNAPTALERADQVITQDFIDLLEDE